MGLDADLTAGDICLWPRHKELDGQGTEALAMECTDNLV